MASRFQCLRPVLDVASKPQCYRAAFSTISRSMAVLPSSSNSLLNFSQPSSPHPAARVGLEIPKFDTDSSMPIDKRTLQVRQEKPRGRVEGLFKEVSQKKYSLLEDASQKQAEQRKKSSEGLVKSAHAEALTRQIRRRWKEGEIYAPKDLGPLEMKKWKSRKTPDYDVFDVLNMNPIDEYKNFSIMSEFITPMGRIKHNKETGLRPVNQRKIAKAIRRAIGMGIMPSVHRHPELLMKASKRFKDQQSPNKPVVNRSFAGRI